MAVFSYRPPPVELGDLPWTDSEFERALRMNVAAVQEALEKHPAQDISDRLISLASMLKIFRRSKEEILRQIQNFHYEVHEKKLLQRNRRHDQQLLESNLQEQLYLFAASAMTLVDQSRVITGKIHIPGYSERIKNDFAENGRHRFIQELRVDLIHLTLHAPGWQFTSGREEVSKTRFLIHSRQLRRLKDYCQAAKNFVATNPDGIDLSLLVSEYCEEVSSLHEWLRIAVEREAGDSLNELRRYRRRVAAEGARFWWQLVFSQMIIPHNRDPYGYLDRYLTEEELNRVQSLPHRSRAQVDLIVELVDENGACDAELRQLVYKGFCVIDQAD
jgi:hypothetical protein